MRYAYWMQRERHYIALDYEVPAERLKHFKMLRLGSIPSGISGSDNISKYYIEKRKMLDSRLGL